MAKDVERALVDIVAQFGARSTDEAVLFVADLKKKGRFQHDVYSAGTIATSGGSSCIKSARIKF